MTDKTNEEIIKEFHRKYDFSENKTLEYDNLVGIGDFILRALEAKDKEHKQQIKDIIESVPSKKINTGNVWDPVDPSGGKAAGWNAHAEEIENWKESQRKKYNIT